MGREFCLLCRIRNAVSRDAKITQVHLTLHKFPIPEKNNVLFNSRVCSVGGDILGLENDHIFKYHHECHKHFEVKYLCRYNRLSNIAVPTLNMPEPTTSVAIQLYSEKEDDVMMKENIDKGILPPLCKDTADILILFDKLFDSVNGSFDKPLLGPVMLKSSHHQLWNE